MNISLPISLLTLAILLLPGAMWLERSEHTLWNNPLLFFSFEKEVNLHTPLFANGTFLPPVISRDTTITAAQNPVLLPGITHVAPGITLTFEPGVNIYAHEYASIINNGTLRIAGNESSPVTFSTNEEHPNNKIWGGLIFEEQSTGIIQHANISYASPGISCMNESSTTITDTTISLANVGVLSLSAACLITDSVISHADTGIISNSPASPATNVTMQAVKQERKQIK